MGCNLCCMHGDGAVRKGLRAFNSPKANAGVGFRVLIPGRVKPGKGLRGIKSPDPNDGKGLKGNGFVYAKPGKGLRHMRYHDPQ